LDVPTTNLQNPKDKLGDSPKKPATPYCIHALPLLNHRAWKQLVFKNVCRLHLHDALCKVTGRIM